MFNQGELEVTGIHSDFLFSSQEQVSDLIFGSRRKGNFEVSYLRTTLRIINLRDHLQVVLF